MNKIFYKVIVSFLIFAIGVGLINLAFDLYLKKSPWTEIVFTGTELIFLMIIIEDQKKGEE